MYRVICDDQHRYFLGDREIPAVSRVLEAAGYFNSRFFTPGSAERGTRAHTALRLDDEGALDEYEFADVMVYVRAYRSWREKAKPRIIDHEKIVYDPSLDTAGRYDLCCEIDGREGIMDWKSGKPAPWHLIQVAGYLFCKYGSRWLSHFGGCLYLRPDGTARPKIMKINEQMAAGHDWMTAVKKYKDREYDLFGG